MPTAGFVDIVALGLSERVRAFDSELADALVNESTGYGWGMCNLRSLDKERFQPLYPAMEDLYNEKVEGGLEAAYRPESYFFVTFMLSYLKLLIRLDPRNEQKYDGESWIRFGNDDLWVGPSWFFDFLFEYLSAYLLIHNARLSAMLDGCRTVHGGGSFRVVGMAEEWTKKMIDAFDHLFNDSHARNGKIIAATLSATVNPRVVAEVDGIFRYFAALC